MEKNYYSFITGCELFSGKNYFNGKNIHQGHDENWNLLLIEEGNVTVMIDEQEVSLNHGDIVLIKPGPIRIFTASTSGWSSEWCHFNYSPHITAEVKWDSITPFIFKLSTEPSDFQRLKHIFSELRRICKIRQIGWYELGYCLVQEIILYGNMIANSGLNHQNTTVTLNAFELQPHKTAGEIAKECAISRTAFFTKFKESFGTSPGAYRESLRMTHACDLLTKENKTISEVAVELNYSSMFYFSNRFKKFYGISPSEYKKKYQRDHFNKTSKEN